MYKKSDVIKKAILHEVSIYLNSDKKSTLILDDLIQFYIGTKEQYKHTINIETTLDLSTFELEGATDIEMKKWLEENSIAYFYNGYNHGSFDGKTLKPFYSFWFVNKEDAAAFKLKWDN